MLGKSISPTGWSVLCQLMCLIHAGFRGGATRAVKRLIYPKVKCSRNIILRAQKSQNKVWKRCQLRPGLSVLREFLGPTGWDAPPAAVVPTWRSTRRDAQGWGCSRPGQGGGMSPGLPERPHSSWSPERPDTQTLFSLVHLIFYIFFLPLERNHCRAVMIHE